MGSVFCVGVGWASKFSGVNLNMRAARCVVALLAWLDKAKGSVGWVETLARFCQARSLRVRSGGGLQKLMWKKSCAAAK